MLGGKNVLLGVTGGIAAYKAAYIASALKKAGAAVDVVMTKNAQKFITPLTFETLTANRVATDTFEHGSFEVEHISLAKKADIAVIAPATANIIAKMAHGIADDMFSTVYLALKCPVIIAPAMNTNMLEHEAVKGNIELLKKRGHIMVEPECGALACGDSGRGRMAEPETIVDIIDDTLTQKDLTGKNVLITAGPTREAIDPVRYISNNSSGKMGYALAVRAKKRGAHVTLVSGITALEKPRGVDFISVVSADDMLGAVNSGKNSADIIIKCAAVADFKSVSVADKKIKKGEGMALSLTPTTDILKELGKDKSFYLVGFAAETNNVESYAKKKLTEKNLDMIVANDVSDKTIGFDSGFNEVTVYKKDGSCIFIERAAKNEVADRILDEITKDIG